MSSPSSSSRVEASLAAITAQLKLRHVDFGSRLDHLSDEMCQKNTRVSRITRRQSCLGGFAPYPLPNPFVESSDSGDGDSDDASGSTHDDEMTVCQ